ncbi:hypothetical protein BGZ96_007063 [Linnemannia gamsii]|uniref:Uncharacterized protein n=1 Tax=Linnemannia gamsii TaxID=64522 RepID=A0ABQ7K1P7_9FUNG|nr:hypothetical protein BGZ96_007063 [Linnemannia gamsii]
MGKRKLEEEISNNTIDNVTTIAVVKPKPRIVSINNTLSTAANSVGVRTETNTATNATNATTASTVGEKIEPQIAINNTTTVVATVTTTKGKSRAHDTTNANSNASTVNPVSRSMQTQHVTNLGTKVTVVGFTQTQPPINNNNNITLTSGANAEKENKRIRKTDTFSHTTSNASPSPKRKKKNQNLVNEHANNLEMQVMPGIGHPFFVLERIRATNPTGGNSARNNINNNSMTNCSTSGWRSNNTHPTTITSTSLVVDLNGDDDGQVIKPSIPPTSDQLGDLVDLLQRTLEERLEEMNMWCSKMTQLMMDVPDLIKAAGQVLGGEAETRALNAAEALSMYGSVVLASCVDACDTVKKRCKDVDGAQTIATTTAAASATVSSTTTATADHSG